eukprot:scaffold3403_cov300-Pinguiococcus_pyrenoidosus.AAC.1
MPTSTTALKGRLDIAKDDLRLGGVEPGGRVTFLLVLAHHAVEHNGEAFVDQHLPGLGLKIGGRLHLVRALLQGTIVELQVRQPQDAFVRPIILTQHGYQRGVEAPGGVPLVHFLLENHALQKRHAQMRLHGRQSNDGTELLRVAAEDQPPRVSLQEPNAGCEDFWLRRLRRLVEHDEIEMLLREAVSPQLRRRATGTGNHLELLEDEATLPRRGQIPLIGGVQVRIVEDRRLDPADVPGVCIEAKHFTALQRAGKALDENIHSVIARRDEKHLLQGLQACHCCDACHHCGGLSRARRAPDDVRCLLCTGHDGHDRLFLKCVQVPADHARSRPTELGRSPA